MVDTYGCVAYIWLHGDSWIAWIAEILGHTSEAMVRKHYGKIIPEDRPNRAKLISGIIGIDYKHELKKVK